MVCISRHIRQVGCELQITVWSKLQTPSLQAMIVKGYETCHFCSVFAVKSSVCSLCCYLGFQIVKATKQMPPRYQHNLVFSVSNFSTTSVCTLVELSRTRSSVENCTKQHKNLQHSPWHTALMQHFYLIQLGFNSGLLVIFLPMNAKQAKYEQNIARAKHHHNHRQTANDSQSCTSWSSVVVGVLLFNINLQHSTSTILFYLYFILL